MATPLRNVTVVLVGLQGMGKTSTMNTVFRNHPDKPSRTTTTAKFKHNIQLQDGSKFEMEIVDTPGIQIKPSRSNQVIESIKAGKFCSQQTVFMFVVKADSDNHEEELAVLKLLGENVLKKTFVLVTKAGKKERYDAFMGRHKMLLDAVQRRVIRMENDTNCPERHAFVETFIREVNDLISTGTGYRHSISRSNGAILLMINRKKQILDFLKISAIGGLIGVFLVILPVFLSKSKGGASAPSAPYYIVPIVYPSHNN